VGTAELEDGAALPIEVARRLACDARLAVVAERPPGPLGIGRTRRQVPAWLGRQLRRRDRGCRFPGCSRTQHLQAHHVKHWAEGGCTDTGNLVLVRGRHHSLVHERGWTITRSPDHGLTFVKPNGRPLRHGPPEIREELRERLGASWAFAAPALLPIH
jgi:hypothetical protein